MGFKFDITTGSINGKPMIARTMTGIENGLIGIIDPSVRNEDDGEGQGLLPLLRKLVPIEPPPTWEVALALSVAFELGKAAVLGKADPAALLHLRAAAKARRQGARNSRIDAVQRAEEWRAVARRIMDANSGSPDEKITGDICAKLERLRLNRSRRTVFNYVRELRKLPIRHLSGTR
jgi:hypothetical protein